MRNFGRVLISIQFLFGGAVYAQQGSISTSIKTKSSDSPSARYSGNLTTSLENSQVTDSTTRTNTSGLSLGADIKYQPLESLRIDLSPRFNYQTGYTQSDEATDAQKSSLTVSNASAIFTPISLAQIEAGAVDQSRIHNKLLLDNSPFPAAVARLRSGKIAETGWSTELVSEYAIPTSSSLSSNTSELEKTPSFSSVGADAKFSGTVLATSIGLHYFQFENIPSSIANKSGLAGNTVEATSGTNRVFAYQYAGISASLASKVRLSKALLLELSGEIVNNQKAPAALSQGYRAGIKGLIRLNADSTLSPEYEFFRIASDAFIAGFADSKYQTNRTGYRTGLGYSYKQMVKIAALVGERVPLLESATQTREKTLDLTLETSHALF